MRKTAIKNRAIRFGALHDEIDDFRCVFARYKGSAINNWDRIGLRLIRYENK